MTSSSSSWLEVAVVEADVDVGVVAGEVDPNVAVCFITSRFEGARTLTGPEVDTLVGTVDGNVVGTVEASQTGADLVTTTARSLSWPLFFSRTLNSALFDVTGGAVTADDVTDDGVTASAVTSFVTASFRAAASASAILYSAAAS